MSLKYNVKFYSLVFLLAFLVVQVTLVLHNVKHGVLEHAHSGKQCEQCVFSKNYNADTPSSALVRISFAEYKVSYNMYRQAVVSTSLLRVNLARAPPFFS